MTVVGTAGHVDHGKSTLLQALTGRDPDRWEEEKRRGLTIDLGFTWTTLPSGREISFVDVPGHERYIKNMLAGIEMVDVALLVVAADEGWMPQSEEHLAVLDLLGVARGVVALTKTDKADQDLIDLATLDVIERLEDSTLAGSPVVAVSAVAGDGLGTLLRALDDAIGAPSPVTEPRLWVDRVFSVSGAGTVVTGTLLGGSVTVGDNLAAYPGSTTYRVRGIESHERSLDEVEPYRRVALNLVGEADGLRRGTMLGRVGQWRMTDRFTARIRPARYLDSVPAKGAYQLHTGTEAVTARLRTLEEGAVVQIDTALPLRYGDRFILRETGRRAVVGGGSVLDPAPPRRGPRLRASAALPTELSPPAAADALLSLRGSARLEELRAHTGAEPSCGVVAGTVAATDAEVERLTRKARAEIDDFHDENPLRPGMPVATLVRRLDVASDLAELVITADPTLETGEGMVSRVGRQRDLNEDQARGWEQTRLILADGGLTPPLAPELPIDVEAVHELVRRGDLVRISESLIYLKEAADRLTEAIRAMPDGFTVSEFRDALGLSRKYAVPVLEWSDRQGFTVRQGDTRRVR